MLKTQNVLLKLCLNKRFYSLKPSADKQQNPYQHTVFLPRTSFLAYLKPEEVIERDKRIREEADFSRLYEWQRKNLKGEYVLHDGPPYANGKPHIGHAINKILKDIILRSQVVQGKRVHYVPGWDCHGLPIELLALKNLNESLTTKEIREKAREIVSKMSEVQMEAFKEWGVMADWNNQCYYTCDKNYVVHQLRIFINLFEKDLIYYGLKPVYWSPSTKTALAEAELVYKNHNSLSVYVRFEVNQSTYPEPLYLLIWTTTPWTVPINQAVYCSSNIKYSVVKISSYPGLYVISTDLIKSFQEKIKANVVKQFDISTEELTNFKYRHPWKRDELLNVYEASNLEILGTGLLHSVPGHGHDDFFLGLKHNLKVESFVDESGYYTSSAGAGLEGLNVLENASNFVITHLSSEILLSEMYQHSYPYDWRSDKPVIIRASNQWFIDCSKLKDRAIKHLDKVKVPLKLLKKNLKTQQFWCLSRQRKWGVPIPVFYHRTSGRPLISRSLVYHICQLFDSLGPDVWWTADLETLFPKRFCDQFFVKIEDVVKGDDIMDIWFDSGISWSYVLNGKKSEVYVEGIDQYRGWFQSSLLTSVAVKDDAPFKKILTHGFAVDEEGRKMSKSLGNVVDPETIVKGNNAYGVDTLRWWVAHHFENDLIPATLNRLKSDFYSVKKLRLTFRFLLGALKDVSEEPQKTDELTYLDRYLLNRCSKFYHSLMSYYNAHNIYKVCYETLNFLKNDISVFYINLIKDRLYCDQFNTPRRKSCLYTINGILNTLSYTMAPILPHLIEEVYLYHPVYRMKKKFFYNKHMWTPPESWSDDSADASIKLLREIKDEGNKKENATNLAQKCCLIQADYEDFELLKKMQDNKEQSIDSQLTEFLQVAEVQLKIGERNISYFPTTSAICNRCKRYTAPQNGELCERCSDLVLKFV